VILVDQIDQDIRDGSDPPRLGRAQKIAQLAAAFESATSKG